MRVLLGLDTSQSHISVALQKDGVLLDRLISDQGWRHGKYVWALIQALLEKQRMPLSRVDCFAITTGPGSFTGIRVGIATVKGLAYAQEKPCVGIAILDLLAASCSEQACPVIAMTDARYEHVFYAQYRISGRIEQVSPYAYGSIHRIAKALTEPTYCVGSGASVYGEMLAKYASIRCLLDTETVFVDTLLFLAWQRIQDGKALCDAVSLAPLYIARDKQKVG